MKKILSVILLFLLASLMIIGSSGTFVQFTTDREVHINVVPHDNEYLAFTCHGNYSNTVIIEKNSNTTFDALKVSNYLNSPHTVWITLSPDYSQLPADVTMWIETEDDSEIAINPQNSYIFTGNVSVGDAPAGEYEIPILMKAYWDSGDAKVSTCPLKLIITNGPSIEKTLISGEETVPANTPQEWTFRITVTNDIVERDLTIHDIIPHGFTVTAVIPSGGAYSLTPISDGTELEWNVTLNPNESAYIDVTIKTTGLSCGKHVLNEGAEIQGSNKKSESINITAICCSSCCVKKMCNIKVSSTLVRVIGFIPAPPVIFSDKPATLLNTIIIYNKGAERDIVLHQEVTSYFSVANYFSTKGSVTLQPLPNGKTLVTWRLHLNHGEWGKLILKLHTDGISVEDTTRVIVTGSIWIDGCRQKGCPTCAKVIKCHCCGCLGRNSEPGSLADMNIDDLDEGIGECEG